jgi:uncharacterized membrane protein (UPF0182 family)
LFYLWVNCRLTVRIATALRGATDDRGIQIYTKNGLRLSSGMLTTSGLIIAAVVALIFAISFYPEWDTYLRFRWGVGVGLSDPIFSKDIGFYLFRLPFYELLHFYYKQWATYNERRAIFHLIMV